MFDAGQVASEGWVLKGGYALELRFHRARSTKDLDLTVRLGRNGPGKREGTLRERLQQAAEIPLSDYFTFIVGEESLVLGQAPGARLVSARGATPRLTALTGSYRRRGPSRSSSPSRLRAFAR